MTDQQQPQPETATTIARTNRMQELREEIGSGQPVALVPRTVAEVQALAGMLAASSLVPQPLRDRPADVAMMIMTGAELGMSPASALRLLYVDRNGIPRLMAGGKAALVRRARVCEYLKADKGNNATSATWRTKRAGEEEQSYTYTIAEANTAGLMSKSESAWAKYPARMLSARAKAWLCDDVYPDITAGMYERDEIDDGLDDAPRFTAPGAPNLSVVPPPADEKPKATRKKRTDTSEASDAEIVDSAPATAKQVQQDKEAAARDEAFKRAREGSEATQAAAARTEGNGPVDSAPNATNGVAHAAPVASDDFGDDAPATKLGPLNCDLRVGDDGKPFHVAGPGHDAPANFAKFLSELAAIKPGKDAEADLSKCKNEWVPWSKQTAAGNAFAPQMRDAFSKRKTELGL